VARADALRARCPRSESLALAGSCPAAEWLGAFSSQMAATCSCRMKPMGQRPACWCPQQPCLEALISRARPCAGFRWRPWPDRRGLVFDEDGSRSAPGGRGVASASLVIAADGRASRLRTKEACRLDQERSRSTILWFRLPAHPRFVGRTVHVQLGATRGFMRVPWRQGRRRSS